MCTQTLIIIGIVAAVLVVSVLFVFIVKKTGLSLINVSLSIVTAVKTALNDAGIANNKFSVVLDLVIQALTYVQAMCDDGMATDIKVDKALDYVKSIARELDITLTDNDLLMIVDVLGLGFTFMGALGITSKSSYKKLYLRMAKYAETSEEIKAIGLESIRG